MNSLINLAKIQSKGLELIYPERPKSLVELLNDLKDKYFSVNAMLTGNEYERNFNSKKNMPSLVQLEKSSYNGYTFEIMDSSKLLSLLGAKLHICVGGYPARGLMKDYHIIAVMENGKPKYCVSISIKDKCVDQMKAKYNVPVVELGLRDFINSMVKF